MNNIGIFKETSLHRHLKYRYSESGKTEVTIGDYVCDGLTQDGELLEVQTGSFGPLKKKIAELSKKESIRIIFPIIIKKNIEVYGINGKLLRKRKSPQKGSAWDVFQALLYAPELLLNSKVIVELAFLDIVEKRIDNGKGSWRRKGIIIDDKIPIALHESIILKCPEDYYFFLPFSGIETFTVKDLSHKAGIPENLARKCLNVLYKTDMVKRVGKEGNSHVYKKSPALK